MNIEINGEGLQIVIKWRVVKSTIKQVLPLIAALLALLAAPELGRLISILGW